MDKTNISFKTWKQNINSMFCTQCSSEDALEPACTPVWSISINIPITVDKFSRIDFIASVV